jgi:hypothetical protein
MARTRICAYVYPGWHPIPERDESFHPGFTEWELVYESKPRFVGHIQPRLPALGRHDDRDPAEVERRIALAAARGIDAVVYGWFWCRGKRVFQDALDLGFLGSTIGRTLPFAVMWANRMPRRVLPVRRADVPVIDPSRLVPSDVDDFVAMIRYVAERYFTRPNYLRVAGKPYFSIFDSTFFIQELGPAAAREAIAAARRWLASAGFGDFHLAAIEPDCKVIDDVASLGFDAVTNYVLLPHWKGDFQQDYETLALARTAEWPQLAASARLPYYPSVSPGWDASPRAADFGAERPRKYPWWPVVVGEHPSRFRDWLARAVDYTTTANTSEPLAFVASLNEWSEGHYLEPDDRFGEAWLDAITAARKDR